MKTAKTVVLITTVLLVLTLGGCFWKKYSDPKNALAVAGVWELKGEVKKDNTTLKGVGTLRITYQDGNNLAGTGSTLPPGFDRLLSVEATGTITDKPDNHMRIYLKVEFPPLSGDFRDVFLDCTVSQSASGTFVKDGKIYLDNLTREVGEWRGVLKK